MRTAADLEYNTYVAVLLRYPNGEQALWVTDEYMAGDATEPGAYSINDINTRVPLAANDDIDALVDQWKLNVEWEEGD